MRLIFNHEVKFVESCELKVIFPSDFFPFDPKNQDLGVILLCNNAAFSPESATVSGFFVCGISPLFARCLLRAHAVGADKQLHQRADVVEGVPEPLRPPGAEAAGGLPARCRGGLPAVSPMCHSLVPEWNPRMSLFGAIFFSVCLSLFCFAIDVSL